MDSPRQRRMLWLATRTSRQTSRVAAPPVVLGLGGRGERFGSALEVRGQLRRLLLAQTDVDAQTLHHLGDRHLAFLHLVSGEEFHDFRFQFARVERGASSHHARHGVVGEGSDDLLPVVAQEVPGSFAGVFSADDASQDKWRILRTDFARQGERDGFLVETLFAEIAERSEEAQLFLRGRCLFRESEELVETSLVASVGQDGDERRHDVGVNRITVGLPGVELLRRFLADVRIGADGAEQTRKRAAQLQRVNGLAFLRSPAELVEDRADDFADRLLERQAVSAGRQSINGAKRAGENRPHVGIGFGGEALHQFEILGGGHRVVAASADRSPRVVDEVEAFDDFQRVLHVDEQLVSQGIAVVNTVEARTASVEHDPFDGVMTLAEVESGFLLIEQDLLFDDLTRTRQLVADMQRHRPDVLVTSRQELELRLADNHRTRIFALANGDDRVTGGLPPEVHQHADRDVLAVLQSALFESVPQLRDSRVRQRVTLEVDAHAAAEGVEASVLDVLEEQRTALFVRDGVEELLDVVRMADGNLNSVSGLQRVERKGAGSVDAELVVDLPLGEHVVHGEVSHDRGERLVEAEAVPVVHGHFVAVPLVSQFVQNDFGNPRLFGIGGLVFVDEQRRVAVGDQPGVFHRARRKVRNRDHVDLVAAEVRTVEEVLEPFHAELAALEREVLEVVLARDGPDAHFLAVRPDRSGRLEFADAEGDEIRRHLGRASVGDDLLAIAERLGLGVTTVGQRGEVLIDDQLDIERRLHGRFVEARERLASVSGFELSGEDLVLFAFGIFPLAEVEALQLGVVDTGEAGVESPLAGCECAIEADDGEFVLGVERDGTVDTLTLLVDHVGAVNLEIGRVEHDAVGGLEDVDLDLFAAGELVNHFFGIAVLGGHFQPGRERDLVVDGNDVLRQAEFLLHCRRATSLTVKHAHI